MIRELKHSDREVVIDFLQRTPNFSDEERVVALELIDIVLNNPGQEDYYFKIAEHDNKAVGYFCVGRRALTKGVFDLYWIVVDPAYSGKGIGSELLMDLEKHIADNGGTLIWVETSSRADYDLTRKFYIKNNYTQLAVIENFYKDNDSLVVYGKYISN